VIGERQIDERAGALANELADRGVESVDLLVVLGSGLGAFADALAGAVVIPGEELEHLPRSAVPGHAGRFVRGEIDGVRVVVQQGRVHLYEGWSAHEVTRAVRALALLGTRALLLTNAAGSLRREWTPPSLMRITDHLNLQGAAPLLPGEGGAATVYDPRLSSALDRAAEEADVELHAGVYAALPGPAYETPAEIRMLARLGADAVGMSTAAEAAAARSAGLRVVGISCLTNHAAGIAERNLTHAEVIAAADRASDSFVRLLTRAVPRIAAGLDS